MYNLTSKFCLISILFCIGICTFNTHAKTYCDDACEDKAKKGDAEAQYKLAQEYQKGDSKKSTNKTIQKEHQERAWKWYQSSAKKYSFRGSKRHNLDGQR